MEDRTKYSLEAAVIFLLVSNPFTQGAISTIFGVTNWTTSALLALTYFGIVYWRMTQTTKEKV